MKVLRGNIVNAAFFCALAVLFFLCAGCGGSGPETSASRIIIESDPPGASVMLRGIDRGVTPLTIEELTPGFHDILLKKENYKRKALRIEVKNANPEQTFSFDLAPLVGSLWIDSNPSGAAVRLGDGTVLGQTPIAKVQLPIGEYTYEVTKENYYPVSETLSVEENFRYEFMHQLKPREATLWIMSRPSGATIFINNQAQQKTSPARFELRPGTYLAGVYTDGYVQKEQMIELAPNEERTLTLEMVRGDVPKGMLLVPAGKFVFGEEGRAPDENPRREIELPAFYIDKYEVTNSDFKKVFPDHQFKEGREMFPVTGVSWNQAMQYARAAGKRLPTEAEWEKAARGTDGREFPWGDTFEAERCNCRELNLKSTSRAGRFIKGASPYGCMDMAGNVYEWVHDWYVAYPGNELVSKDYGQIFRVLRGGSYMTTSYTMRCARRHFDRMDAARADYGFRCAMDVK
jgi:formylglycine-generating enzyme required for sulfatase activity